MSITKKRLSNMKWTTPCFTEIKMDAEISSYQEETDPFRDGPRFVDPHESSREGQTEPTI